MKTALVAVVFAVASFPLLGQQPSPASSQPDQPTNPAAQQTAPPGAQPSGSQTAPPAAAPETSAPSQPGATSEPTAASQPAAIDMRPVNAKLVGKLDSKTAKSGDSVAVETRGSVKTADGTEIPKGSKLTGHVVAVKASGGETSQVVLQFDHAELKGGQTLPIHTEIESVSPAGGSTASMDAEAMPSGGMNSNSPSGSAGGTNSVSSAQRPAGTSAAVPANGPSAAGSGAPQPGTIVSRNGNIAIHTTSIPGVLLANNAPGQQDPRMAQASGILLGAKKDVQLDGGTEMVLGVAATGSAQ